MLHLNLLLFTSRYRMGQLQWWNQLPLWLWVCWCSPFFREKKTNQRFLSFLKHFFVWWLHSWVCTLVNHSSPECGCGNEERLIYSTQWVSTWYKLSLYGATQGLFTVSLQKLPCNLGKYVMLRVGWSCVLIALYDFSPRYSYLPLLIDQYIILW